MFKKISNCDKYYFGYSVDDRSVEEILIRDFRGNNSVLATVSFNTHVLILRNYKPRKLRDGLLHGEYTYVTVYSFYNNVCDWVYKRINDDIEGIVLTCADGIHIDDSLIMKFIEEYPNR